MLRGVLAFQYSGEVFPWSERKASCQVRGGGRPCPRLKQLCQIFQISQVSISFVSVCVLSQQSPGCKFPILLLSTYSCFRSTTFLNACIMHGYFTMVRTRALRTMNRAHSVAKKPFRFPLSAVARMLAFPNPRKVSQ